MQPEEVKQKIRKLMGEQIEFEWHFERVIENIDENLQQHLLDWIRKCNNLELLPFTAPIDRELLVFFFKPNVTNIRGILKKRKNSYFIALFLDKHKYYDQERKQLGF